MEYVSSFDAKTHLSKLLAEVATGKEYIITNRNRPVAMLTPIPQEKVDVTKIIAAIKLLKKKYKKRPLSQKEILSFRDDGRK